MRPPGRFFVPKIGTEQILLRTKEARRKFPGPFKLIHYRYTGSGPWNKKLNLDGKLYYCCNYHKLIDISCFVRLTRYKILNRNLAAKKLKPLEIQIKICYGVCGTFSAYK